MLPPIIDLQARLVPLQARQIRFLASGMTDLSLAPTEKDRGEHLALEQALTEEMRKFAEGLAAAYRPISEQLQALKAAMNEYIYRPIDRTAIDRD